MLSRSIQHARQLGRSGWTVRSIVRTTKDVVASAYVTYGSNPMCETREIQVHVDRHTSLATVSDHRGISITYDMNGWCKKNTPSRMKQLLDRRITQVLSRCNVNNVHIAQESGVTVITVDRMGRGYGRSSQANGFWYGESGQPHTQ